MIKTKFFNSGVNKNYYSTVDNTVLTHSNIIEKHYDEYVSVRFERPKEGGFDFAECEIPFMGFKKTYGFDEDELFELEDYVIVHYILIWESSIAVDNA